MIDYKTVISQSSYRRGKRCLKSFWLHRNRKVQLPTPQSDGRLIKLTSKELVDAAAFIFDKKPSDCTILRPDNTLNWDDSVMLTQETINNGERLLSKPSFYTKNLMCSVDYLEKNEDNSWSVYIVKSSTRIAEISIEKAAFQLYTLITSGLIISHFYCLTVNNKYQRKKSVNYTKLFKKTDIIHRLLTTQKKVESRVLKIQETLKQQSEPNINIGEYCLSPYPCQFKSHCWKSVPKESVFELNRVPRETKFNWWNSGIKTINDLQQSKYESGILLSENQKDKHINQRALNEFLSHITFPILFLDFEGYLPAIPQFEGAKPFEIIPFLFAAYTCHSIDEKPIFNAFISTPKKDSRLDFAIQLISLCKNVNSILVYDPMTEKKVINNLITTYPELAASLKDIRSKIIDLAKPITKKQFYLPAMKGLSSMKHVLPAINNQINYSNLNVQSGRAASQLYQILCSEKHNKNTKQELENLTEYCKMDVVGLVQVYNAFQQAIGKKTIDM